MFEELVKRPPSDVWLMEGRHVREGGAQDRAIVETERELEDRLSELCASTHGAVVLVGSAQHLDRLATTFRAARRSGCQLVADLYGPALQLQHDRRSRNQGSRH